ncbi:MAG: DUF5060 domain-containing protein [Verrucomicrobiota bacterium]
MKFPKSSVGTRPRFFIHGFLLLFLTGLASVLEGTQIHNESGGLVVIEMENTPSDYGLWVLENEGLEGTTGEGFLRFTGNRELGGEKNSPLEYRFRINKPRLYYLVLHCAKETFVIDGETRTDVANDRYVRVDGDYDSGPNAGDKHKDDARLKYLQSDYKFFGGDPDAYEWAWGHRLDLGKHRNKRVAIYDFKAGEDYTLTIHGRSKEFRINRILFRHESVDPEVAHDPQLPESELLVFDSHSYSAMRDFDRFLAAESDGEVDYYKDRKRRAFAIDAGVVSNRDRFARASIPFDGTPGTYDLTLTALRELDGECSYRLLVNGEVIGEATNAMTDVDYAPQEHQFRSVRIPTGAILSVESNAVTNGKIPEGDGTAFARGRWTKLELSPAATASTVAPDQIVELSIQVIPEPDSPGSPTNRTQELSKNKQNGGTAIDVDLLPDPDGYEPPVGTQARISGELKKWHKITLDWIGPETSEIAEVNPLADYRLDVTFTHPGGTTYIVPGYYAADGNAANTSADSGNVWRAHFAPDEIGEWTYEASFRQGPDVALSNDPGAGSSANFFDGDSGEFEVDASDKTGRDLRGKGRLEYVGKHHLQFAETGEYFLKAGADAPENLLAYDDFDDTPNDPNGSPNLRKSWSPHAADFDIEDAAAYTWKKGNGTELLGAIRYLSDTGMNVFSFLTFSLDGDDDNVFPHRLIGSVADYESLEDNTRWANDEKGVYHDRFDVSKLDQWERIFEYADKKGMYLHFKTQETENDDRMDGGELGRTRKLYYRELIARYAHHLALNWNLGEENTNSVEQQRAFAQYISDTDPYDHSIVIHTYPNQKEKVYPSLLGDQSALTGASLQGGKIHFKDIFPDVKEWVERSAAAGKPWVVATDEPGDAKEALRPASDPGNSWNMARKFALWGTVMAGGAGSEYYFGYRFEHSDLTAQDFRSRDGFWDFCRYQLEFFYDNQIPFQDLSNTDLSSNPESWCLSQDGGPYVVYLQRGGTTDLDLSETSGDFSVRWYDPLLGGALQEGTVSTIQGGASVNLGSPPSRKNQDWVVLITPSLIKSGGFGLMAPMRTEVRAP